MASFLLVVYLTVSASALALHPLPTRGMNQTAGLLDWDAAREKASTFASQLSLEEKVFLVTGGNDVGGCIGNIGPIPRLDFNGICMSDGPQGLNRADLVSVFPSGITIAASWDRKLMYDRAFAIGAEFRAKGSHVYLGPSVNPMGRHALGGRNWEGFGPDPYLAGIAMATTIRGVQDNGVQTSSKHFIANEQETQRSNTTDANGVMTHAISSNVDDRTLHELYLWPFADGIRAGTTSIMCSYNRVNSTYACENELLIKDILRDEMGFQGYVVSDWYATHSTAKAANAGLDVEMPGRIETFGVMDIPNPLFFGDGLLAAIHDGQVDRERLDKMVEDVLTPFYALGQDSDFPSVDPSTLAVLIAGQFGLPDFQGLDYPIEIDIVDGRDVRADHANLIRSLGAAGTVLLKNVNNTLPLHKPRNIAVFGNDAGDLIDGLYPDLDAYEMGTIITGGGSGTQRIEEVVTPLDAIKARAAADGSRVKYLLNNTKIAEGDWTTVYPLPDVCLVFLKTWASEGDDRKSLECDWSSTAVVDQIASWCENTVVVTHSGGVNTMPWAQNDNVKAILAAHYPGEQSGNSLVDVLYGDVAPSGRLPYTIPKKAEDYGIPIVNLTGSVGPGDWQSDFSEGQMIDYRYYDANNIEPLYEFGFGLTYTTFDMPEPLTSTLLVTNATVHPRSGQKVAPGGHADLWVELAEAKTQVCNTGTRSGMAVPQLYVSFPEASTPPGTPVRALRGFDKISLAAGKCETVTFRLMRRDLSYWDTESKTWTIPPGKFTLTAGFSSRDLKGAAELQIHQ